MSRFSPVLPIIGEGRARFQPVAVQTVASAFVKSVTEPAAIGQAFDLCGQETFTFEEMLDEILAALGRKRMKLHVPLGIARFQAAMLEWVFPKLLRRPPPLNRDQITMLQEDSVGNSQKAIALFGLKQTRFREGICAYLGK
jgi:NADH dehydrogenase